VQEVPVLIVLTAVNILLILYLFLLSLRIVLGWFAPQALGKAWRLLTGVTDPYLNVFRRIGFLRGGLFDFTPIAAILALVVALDLVTNLMYYGRITLGFFLASVFSAAWTGVQYLLLFFLIVGIVRTIPLLVRSSSGSGIWKVVDMIIQPVVTWVSRLLRLGLRVRYQQQLLFAIGLLFVAWLAGRLLVPQLISLLQMIPV
jgi:YggT family protein